LETLAELGPLGLALVLALLCYPLVRTLRVRAVPGLPAAAGASAAFLLHAGVDWDWELPAVLTAGLCCLAAVLVADERPLDRPAPRWLAAGAFALSLALAALSLAGAASSTAPSASAVRRAVAVHVRPLLPVMALPVLVPVPLLPLERLEPGAGAEMVAVPQVCVHRVRGDDDRVPRVLPRAGVVADRRPVLVLRRGAVAVLRAGAAVGVLGDGDGGLGAAEER